MSFTSRIRRAASAALDLVFPGRCVSCGREGSLVCETCLDDATRLDQRAVCRRCARPMRSAAMCARCAEDPPPLASLVAVFAFDGAVRAAVHALKYDGVRGLIPLLGAEMMAAYGARRARPDAVVPVPLHRRRLRERGYNQAALLARPIAEALGAPVVPGLLERIIDTPRQVVATNEAERARQVAGAFLAGESARGRSVLLVDDVCTTASTLNSAARALRDAGAARVSALVLAREL